MVIQWVAAVDDLPTVSDTKLNFLKAYKRPIPSIYNTVLQELIMMRIEKAIFQAYINALKEDPKQYSLCAALNINKRSVDRDLDVYRNLLSKLVQAKELLKEYVDREKKKVVEKSRISEG
ncbi:hypothetical protein HHK36_032077 [Tetracentron sinense]|uniref:Uncharacterized protein n=1 Tax=Tetracentron sinense TaxID=13715 RepID=A0A834YBB2_TETSI|nr:hypothetical protein HHK36_032077 [Tetracentron sinense]